MGNVYFVTLAMPQCPDIFKDYFDVSVIILTFCGLVMFRQCLYLHVITSVMINKSR